MHIPRQIIFFNITPFPSISILGTELKVAATRAHWHKRIFLKIFEKEVESQLMTYLENNDLITIDQSAYIKQHNTHTALHEIIDDWRHNMSDRNLTAVSSVDTKQCIDTISHWILLKKMELYGIQPEVIKWFRSYLKDRGRVVLCHNELSEKRHNDIGVPQH